MTKLPSSSRRAVIVLGVALLTVAGGSAAATDPDLDQAEQWIVEQTNQLRRSHDLAATAENLRLQGAARAFARFMARSGQYGHEADGRQPVQRTRAAGYEECMVAENIALQYSSSGFGTKALAEGFFDGWLNSPGHRRNMLNGDVTETAVAIARSERDRYYAVQLFGRPASQSIRFQIGNRAPQAVRYELDGKAFDLPPRATRTHVQCGAPAVQLQLPGDATPKLFRPGAGDRLRVEVANGRWRVLQD